MAIRAPVRFSTQGRTDRAEWADGAVQVLVSKSANPTADKPLRVSPAEPSPCVRVSLMQSLQESVSRAAGVVRRHFQSHAAALESIIMLVYSLNNKAGQLRRVAALQSYRCVWNFTKEFYIPERRSERCGLEGSAIMISVPKDPPSSRLFGRRAMIAHSSNDTQGCDWSIRQPAIGDVVRATVRS